MNKITRGALIAANAVGGVILSITAFLIGYDKTSFLTLVYWGVLPGFPFLVLGYLGYKNKSIGKHSLLFMTLGALLVTITSYGQLFLLESHGANIGAGLLIFYSPLSFVVAIVIGWAIGELFYPQT